MRRGFRLSSETRKAYEYMSKLISPPRSQWGNRSLIDGLGFEIAPTMFGIASKGTNGLARPASKVALSLVTRGTPMTQVTVEVLMVSLYEVRVSEKDTAQCVR